MNRRYPVLLQGTSAAAASTTVIASINGLSRFDFITFDAVLLGATGGTLDIYLQRKLATDVWLDWARFTQLTAATPANFSFCTSVVNVIATVGKWADAGTGTQVLAANACVGGHPGDILRMVGVAGSGTSLGAIQSVYINGFTSYT